MVPVFLWEEERHREESCDPLLMKIVVPSGMPIKPKWVRLVGITQLSQAGWLKHSATKDQVIQRVARKEKYANARVKSDPEDEH